MEAENTFLKEEIRRLQYLNRLLTDRVLALEGDLPLSKNQQGGIEVSLPHSQNMQGSREDYLPHSENMEAGNYNFLPHSENAEWGMESSLPHSGNMQGGIDGSLPYSENVQGGIPSFTPVAKYFANDDYVVAYIAQSLKRAEMKEVRRKTLTHVAAALLHISRGGQLDYHFARSHYGYSERGASKFITMLVRRGVLARRGGRALFLTPTGGKQFPEGFFA